MRIRSFLAGFVAVGTLVAADPAFAATTYLTAARLVDTANGRVVTNPAVVITDDRIVAVGTQGQLAVPAGAKRVDLGDHTLLPGLIDMHVHLDSSPKYGGYRRLQFTDRFWTVIATTHARRTLEAGFTTVRNVGARDDWSDVGLRQAIAEGIVVGPRIVTATSSFGATGGHCDSATLPPSVKDANPYSIKSLDQARESVRELRKYGAQVIKICATGGVFSRNTALGQQQLNLDEIETVVKEARMWGLNVAAHAHGADGIRAAILGGVTTVEHASYIDAEGIRLAKEKGTALSMDIYNTEYTLAEGKANGVEEENLAKEREVGGIQRENFRKAHEAGVTMVFGTDAGIYPHGDNAKQFAVMVRFGMTPMQAIQAATVNAARALGSHGANVGVIAPGKFADIIAVKGDPTRDVTTLEKAAFVMKGGTVFVGPGSEESAR